MTGGDRTSGSGAGSGRRVARDGDGNGGGTDAGDPENQAPVGTLFVLMIYLMVLAGMWGTMYWLLVSR